MSKSSTIASLASKVQPAMASDATNTFPIVDRWSYGWLGLGAFLGLFNFGPWTIPLAPWLAILFSMRFIHSQKPLRGYVVFSLVRMVVTAVILREMLPSFIFPDHIRYAVIILSSLSGNLPYLVDRLIAPRLNGIAATLVFPTAFTAWEFFTLSVNPIGTFGALAYTQYGNLPLMQVVSVTGLSGVTFLIAWFGSTGNWVWERSFVWSVTGRCAVLYATVAALVLLSGGARLVLHEASTESMQIACFSLKGLGADFRTLAESDPTAFQERTRDVHNRYFDETRRQADAGAQLILWPEAAGICAREDEAALVDRGRALARNKGIYLAMPLFTQSIQSNRRPENKLIVVDPNGDVVFEHFKYGGNEFEGSVLGNAELQTFQTTSAQVSGVICWDMDFPVIVRQVGYRGADILLAPANDWEAVSTTHAHMAVFRAVENGVSIVRQAKNGLSIVTDPYGRTLAKMDHFTTDRRLMVAQVPTTGVTTVYSRVGDLFAWMSALAFFLLAGVVVFERRMKRHSTHSSPER